MVFQALFGVGCTFFASNRASTGCSYKGKDVFYVELRRSRVRSNADLFVDGMRRYWASSALRTQL